MLKLTGYSLTEQLHESNNSLVYRGIKEEDSLAVILKVLKKEYPSFQELSRFQKEYEITHNLKNFWRDRSLWKGVSTGTLGNGLGGFWR